MSGFLRDKKNLVIVLLSALFIIKIPQESRKFIFWLLLGVSLCIGLDYLLNSLFLKRKIFPKSAIISGFIVAGILDYRQPWPVLVIFSCLAITSKHLIRFNKKHIFNPANFALFIATLFRLPLTWNIESNVFLIGIFGVYLAYSYRKIFHILSFLFFFAGLFAISGVNALGTISWFFLFIMLIEPKTSGAGALRGFIFGGLCALSSFLIFKNLTPYDPFISSLFLANLCNPLLERLKPR